MPNWVLNEVTVTGKKENIANMMKDIDAKSDGSFKFESVLPMPEELKDTEGNIENMLKYMLDNNLDFSMFENDDDIIWGINMKLNMMKSFGIEIPKEELEIGGFNTAGSKLRRMYELKDKYDPYKCYDEKDGQKQYNNYLKYNVSNWYDWRCKNYGCKWDCSDGYVSEPFENDNNEVTVSLSFCTPWSMPEPFLSYFAYKYNVVVKQMYADEDIGVNCGKGCYVPWARVIHHVGYDCTEESIKFARELWGEDEEENEDYLETKLADFIAKDGELIENDKSDSD